MGEKFVKNAFSSGCYGHFCLIPTVLTVAACEVGASGHYTTGSCLFWLLLLVKWVALVIILHGPACFYHCFLWSRYHYTVMPVLIIASCEVGGFRHYTARSRLFWSLLLVKWVPVVIFVWSCFFVFVCCCFLSSRSFWSSYCTLPLGLIVATCQACGCAHFRMVSPILNIASCQRPVHWALDTTVWRVKRLPVSLPSSYMR